MMEHEDVASANGEDIRFYNDLAGTRGRIGHVFDDELTRGSHPTRFHKRLFLRRTKEIARQRQQSKPATLAATLAAALVATLAAATRNEYLIAKPHRKGYFMKKLKLTSGYEIPQLGLGTWQLTGDTCTHAVRDALNMGYTHIDTADGYKNHKEVAAGIKQADVSRESLFITTKIGMGSQSSEAIRQFGDRLVKELEVDYVDLLLIHWPTKKVPFAETIEAMNKLVDKGQVKSIGVSNFNKDIAAEVSQLSRVPVVTNQVEFHPMLYQKELLAACMDLGMYITAYSPLGQGKALSDPVINQVARKHSVSPAQVCIAWLLSKDIIVIPKGSSVPHLEDNLKAADLVLDDEDIKSIDANPNQGRIVAADGWRHYDF